MRTVLQQMGTLVAQVPMLCVSSFLSQQSSADAINALIFAGYGKGTLAQQGSAQTTGKISQYTFAADFRDTSSNPAAPRLALRMWYNNTGYVGSQGPAPVRRIHASLNALVNGYLRTAFNSTVSAKLLYVRDMPKPSACPCTPGSAQAEAVPDPRALSLVRAPFAPQTRSSSWTLRRCSGRCFTPGCRSCCCP